MPCGSSASVWVAGRGQLPLQNVLIRVGARRQPQLLNAVGDRVIVVVVGDVADVKAYAAFSDSTVDSARVLATVLASDGNKKVIGDAAAEPEQALQEFLKPAVQAPFDDLLDASEAKLGFEFASDPFRFA